VIAVDSHLLWYTVHDSEFTDLAARVASVDARWVAPPLWRSELRNTVAGYIRRGQLGVDQAITAVERASALLSAEPIPETAAVLALVVTSRCTAYDLEYVAVAQSLGVQLVTNDRQILDSFPGIAVSLESFASGSE
jgi:predicted nucleic acid-binding protein